MSENNGQGCVWLCKAVQGCACYSGTCAKVFLHSWSCDLVGGSHVTIQFIALLLFCAKSLSWFKVNFTQNKIQA
jgi:hypothetical protein